MSNHVIVPHDALSQEALTGVIDDFVTREGTDYGHVEHSLEQKRASVLRQLKRGEVLIVFDGEAQAVTLVRREDLPRSQIEEDV